MCYANTQLLGGSTSARMGYPAHGAHHPAQIVTGYFFGLDFWALEQFRIDGSQRFYIR
jgi:hypothetical protein